MALLASGCSETIDPGPRTLVGVIYNDTGAVDNPGIKAIELALQDVNDAQVLEKPLVPVPFDFNAYIDRKELAVEMIEDYGIQVIFSEWSSTAQLMLELSEEQFPSVLHCNGNSTAPGVNDGDVHDTMFRAVGEATGIGNLMWGQIEDHSKVGMLTRHDAWGDSLAETIREVAAGFDGLVVDGGYELPFNMSAAMPDVEAVLQANQQGTLDTVLLVAFSEGVGEIVKALVEANPPFEGKIFLAAVQDSWFRIQTSSLTQWLSHPGNRLLGATEENSSGLHSADWIERFNAFATNATVESYTTASADCGYAVATAMMYAEVRDGDPLANLPEHMRRMETVSLADTAGTVGTPTPEGMREVRAAIERGELVRVEGAAGPLEFNAVGDRALQLYRIQEVEADGGFAWDRGSVWDPTTSTCVADCL